MSNIEMKHAVLRIVLQSAKKDFICPLCFTSYSRADSALLHCRNEGKEENERMDNEEQKTRCLVHRGLGAVNTGGSFRGFLECLTTACGRKETITAEELPVKYNRSGRRSYGSCLKRHFILDMMTSEFAAKGHVLRERIKFGGVNYACPYCLSGFETCREVLSHCAKEEDENHQGLLSTEVELFARFYGQSMGSSIETAFLRIDFGRNGTPLFDRCFEIDEVLRQMMAIRLAAKVRILRKITKTAGIHYACPQCLSGFATCGEVLSHCAKEEDENHQGLLSAEIEEFARFYGQSMGRSIDSAILRIDFGKRGTPSFDRCFDIHEVLRHKTINIVHLDGDTE